MCGQDPEYERFMSALKCWTVPVSVFDFFLSGAPSQSDGFSARLFFGERVVAVVPGQSRVWHPLCSTAALVPQEAEFIAMPGWRTAHSR